MTFSVRRLSETDLDAYRSIRLESLAAEPASFGATLEEDAARTDEQWRAAFARNWTFGVFSAEDLCGIASYYIETGDKAKHRGHLVGVYVRPALRGSGASQLLIAELIASARQNVQFLYLQVIQDNPRAVRFYERMGFVIYGNDPGGLLVDGIMHQDYLMLLRLEKGGTESDRQ